MSGNPYGCNCNHIIARIKLQLQLYIGKVAGMAATPDDVAVQAWARLVRAQQLLLERVEAALKAAELPPLRWYDVLLELHRAGPKGLRQFEIGAAVLLNKYNVSRLLDRLEDEQFLMRRACDEDGRGAQVQITPKGRELIKRMWLVYGPAIDEHFSRHFSASELKQLASLLGRVPDVAR
jgi:DNA-binding MarR family transcriptional regulator